jgi:hypothetical protein
VGVGAAAVAAVAAGLLAAPAGATVSTNCQYAGSRSLQICVSQVAASRLTVGGGTREDPYGYEQIRVTSYRVRVKNLDPRAVTAIRVSVRAAVAADCVEGCEGRLLENEVKNFGLVRGRQVTKPFPVPWRRATTRADRTGRNYQVGSATVTWKRHGNAQSFQTDNVCAGTLKFGDQTYGFCDAP